jgi:ankyrin repeat protein
MPWVDIMGSAIQAAADVGNVEVVEYLLSNGADANLAGGQYGCALQAAAIQNYDRVVEVLLEHGANVNAEGGEYGAAVIAAAGNSRWTALKLLLEKGADVNRTSKKYGTAMYQCLMNYMNQLRFPKYSGEDKQFIKEIELASSVIQLLVYGGADPNISGAY